MEHQVNYINDQGNTLEVELETAMLGSPYKDVNEIVTEYNAIPELLEGNETSRDYLGMRDGTVRYDDLGRKKIIKKQKIVEHRIRLYLKNGQVISAGNPFGRFFNRPPKPGTEVTLLSVKKDGDEHAYPLVFVTPDQNGYGVTYFANDSSILTSPRRNSAVFFLALASMFIFCINTLSFPFVVPSEGAVIYVGSERALRIDYPGLWPAMTYIYYIFGLVFLYKRFANMSEQHRYRRLACIARDIKKENSSRKPYTLSRNYRFLKPFNIILFALMTYALTNSLLPLAFTKSELSWMTRDSVEIFKSVFNLFTLPSGIFEIF